MFQTFKRFAKSTVCRSTVYFSFILFCLFVAFLASFYSSSILFVKFRKELIPEKLTIKKHFEKIATDQDPGNPLSKKTEKKCTKEKNKIGFLKTHKTASSSVQNIFLRYGLMNRLEFVLPSRGNHLNNPQHFYVNMDKFQVEFLDEESSKLLWHEELKKTQGYHIYALHSRWNQSAVSSLLGPDAVYVTILRRPRDVFESLFSYVKFEPQLKLTLSQYIQSLNVSSTLFQHRINGYLGLNQQLFDLGQNLSDLYDRPATEQMLKTIEENFDLVMIAEQYEESMILLADLLCWPLEKLTSLKVNARKPELKQKISKNESQILSQWQEGDELVYNYFAKKFEEKVQTYGPERMAASVQRLRKLNSELEKRCVLGVTDKQHLDKEPDLAPWSPDVVAYNVPSTDFQCKLMAMNENSFVDKVRKSQLNRWKAKEKLASDAITAHSQKPHQTTAKRKIKPI